MNKVIIFLIKSYQKNQNQNLKHCRFSPSCSSYGLACFEKFGFFKASFLTMMRILRCTPLSRGGYDPVPKNIVEKIYERATSTQK